MEHLPEKMQLISDYFEKFKDISFVGDVRQCGMIGGIELVTDKKTKQSFPYQQKIGAKVCAAMRPKGAMMRPLGDVIVLMPAVAMDAETLHKLLDVIEDTLKNDLMEIMKKC